MVGVHTRHDPWMVRRNTRERRTCLRRKERLLLTKQLWERQKDGDWVSYHPETCATSLAIVPKTVQTEEQRHFMSFGQERLLYNRTDRKCL